MASNGGSPPPASGSSSQSPPPPSSPSPSPPPPQSNSSPPPPSSDSGNSPPPPSNNNGNSSQPPPSDSGNDKSQPPPSNSSPSKNGSSRPPPAPHHPPPPPHSGHPPPPRHKLLPSRDGEDSSNQKMIIAGAAAGAGLLLLIMIVFLISCGKRKKRKPHDQMHYYKDDSHVGKNDFYLNGQKWHPQSSEHVMKMPQSGAVSSEFGWPLAPPPPPPMMHSSDMSSAAFSGPYSAPMPPPHPGVALGFNQSSFSYDELAAATGGFSRNNLLGQGGFGYVHKGVLPNGKEVAVKSLKSNSGQGEREFQAEVDIISRVHHRHLVSLVGYCIAGEQRMLVYEFVANNTLEYHLHGKGAPVMEWPTRLRIALGSAKGFAYLHEDCHPRIIHRDIKAANILLDENLEAKVADFGLAKLSSDTNTHVSTRIMGTFGYLAPEYASSGKLTEKSDVFSYGVMLLELITGRRPVDVNSEDDSLVDWARPILQRVVESGGSFEELVDPRLEHNYHPEEMLRMVACAAASIRHSARRRPKMSQIVRALEGDVSLDDLGDKTRAGHGSMASTGGSDYDSAFQTDLRKFMKTTGLSSQEFNSEEHNRMTGDFGHSSGESTKISRP